MKTMEENEEKDPSEISDEVREFIEKMHKDKQESRPDEGWRIKPMDKPESIAPYKKDEEEMDKEPGVVDQLRGLTGYADGGVIPGYDDGGEVDPNALLQSLAPAGASALTPPIVPPPTPKPAAPMPAGFDPQKFANNLNASDLAAGGPEALDALDAGMPSPAAPAARPTPSAPPAMTDQNFMDRANKMLGLNPQEQAGFMNLLGKNAQKAQIGSAVAGIGDAIAAGGTLGKVNPGALNKSEELIQGRTNEGLQGLQSIRENQGKAQELSDKLEARDPNSPLSKYAQKAYAGIGKKLGLDLSNASAALIGDVSGKGVEALKADYEQQLKTLGLDLQKKQVEATIGNQKAERDIARQGQQLSATEKLGSRTLGNKLEGIIPGTSANTERKSLERIASGGGNSSYAPDVMAYADKHGITPEAAQAQKDRRTKGQ